MEMLKEMKQEMKQMANGQQQMADGQQQLADGQQQLGKVVDGLEARMVDGQKSAGWIRRKNGYGLF